MGKEAKTNAMRILEREKVPYTAHEYAHEEGVAVAGVDVAGSMGEDPACVYKTLVTQGSSKNYFVFVIPVAAELDLKAAARSVGEKSVAMIHVADINKVTGYVRGGCSPVGMKKQFVTVLDESILAQPTVMVSGGRIGTQVELAPADLIKAARATTAAITMGVGTVMAAKKIVMVITGADKADILYKVFFGPVTPEVPGSILQFHPDVTLICDEAAAARMPQ